MVKGFKCREANPPSVFQPDFYRWIAPDENTRILLGKKKNGGKTAAREVCKRIKK